MTGLTVPHRLMGSGNSQPQLMSNVAGTYQYGAHITSDAGCVVYRRSLATGAIDNVFDLSTISGNPLSLPLDDPTDGHYIISIGVDEDEVLHVVGNDHDDDPVGQRYVYCPASGMTTAANWTRDATQFEALGAGGGIVPGYTYNIFDRTSTGTLLWFFSQSEDWTASTGRDWLGFKRVDGAWEPIVSDGHFATTTVDPDRVYIKGVECHPRLGQSDRVFVSGIWRMDNLDGDTQLEPWMLYSDDLSTWRNMDGTTHTMPITWANRSGATITTDTNYTDVQLGIAVDPVNLRPYVTLRYGISTDPERFDMWVWADTFWFSSQVTPLVGQIRPVILEGQLYMRHVGAGSRVALKNWATGNTFFIGGPMTPGGIHPNHDPIRLRRSGIYSMCIGDGSTPVVYEYGAGARGAIA